MGVSNLIKALLSITGKKQSDLIGVLHVTSKQALCNKFTNERWTAADLITIADFCESEISFTTKDGQKLILKKTEE